MVGITSYGVGKCGDAGKYTGFADVSLYTDWINLHLNCDLNDVYCDISLSPQSDEIVATSTNDSQMFGGYSLGTGTFFNPGQLFRRGQTALTISRWLYNYNKDDYTSSLTRPPSTSTVRGLFPDIIDRDSELFWAAYQLNADGVFQGETGGNFNDGLITRHQFVLVITRILLKHGNITDALNQARQNGRAGCPNFTNPTTNLEPIELACEWGLITNMLDANNPSNMLNASNPDDFNPDGYVTREIVADVLCRAFVSACDSEVDPSLLLFRQTILNDRPPNTVSLQRAKNLSREVLCFTASAQAARDDLIPNIPYIVDGELVHYNFTTNRFNMGCEVSAPPPPSGTTGSAIYDVSPTGWVGCDDDDDIIKVIFRDNDASRNVNVEFAKCDGSLFSQNGDAYLLIDGVHRTESLLSYRKDQRSYSFNFDPVASGFDGSHNYLLDIRSVDDNGIPKYTAPVTIWESHEPSSGVANYEVSSSSWTSCPSDGIIKMRLIPSDTDHNITVEFEKCDRFTDRRFSQDGTASLLINNGTDTIPLGTYRDGDTRYSMTFAPLDWDLSGRHEYMLQIWSSDEDDLPKNTRTIDAWDVPIGFGDLLIEELQITLSEDRLTVLNDGDEVVDGTSIRIAEETVNCGEVVVDNNFDVRYYDNGRLIETDEESSTLDPNCNEDAFENYTFTLSGVGRHIIEVCLDTGNDVEEENEYNNCASQTLFVVPPDTSAPTVSASLGGTAGDNRYYRSNVNVTLDAIDNYQGSGVANLQYRTNNGAWQTVNSRSKTMTVSTEGETIISYRATDQNGNRSAANSLTVNVDKTDPSVQHNSLMGAVNGWHTGNRVNVSLAATDTRSDVNACQYHLGNYVWQPLTDCTGNIGVTNEGVTTVFYRAIDNAGNVSNAKSMKVNIDRTAPTISDMSLNNGGAESYARTLVVGSSAADTHSGIHRMCISSTADFAGGCTWQAYDGSVLFAVPAENGSTQTVYFKVRDKAGHESTISSDTIRLNFYPAAPSSSSYQLCSSTFASVAGVSGSSSYQLISSAGNMGGESSNGSYSLQSGFLGRDNCSTDTAEAPISQPPPSQPQVVQGDVSCDSSFNIIDALFIAQFAVGKRSSASSCPLTDSATQLNVAGCDVNSDGNCNIIDALFVAQCSVGKTNVLCP